MKSLILVFLTVFSTFSWAETSPKYALGDKVYLKNPGFYRNCDFPAFVEFVFPDGDYVINFYCPTRDENKRLVSLVIEEQDLIVKVQTQGIVK